MKIKYIFYTLGVILFLGSCSRNKAEAKRIPLLEVEGRFLYKDVVDKIIPPTASKIDSAEITDRFIRKWVTDVLMYKNGERNIQDKETIEEQVEEYRKTLVIQQYERALIQERVPDSIPENDLKAFYDQYGIQLASTDNLIKGALLIVPKNAVKIDQAREWMRSLNSKNIENLERFSLKNAISFDYFANNWTSLDEILKKAPFKTDDTRSFVSTRSFVEMSDSTKIYMLRITNSVPIGNTEPYEMAREKIKTIMLNKHQSDFIIQFEKDIYNDAVKDGSINYFKQ